MPTPGRGNLASWLAPLILYMHTAFLPMNAALRPEVLRLLQESPQNELPLAAEGVLRYVWESRFGKMLIEVKDEAVFVNGACVEQFQPRPVAK